MCMRGHLDDSRQACDKKTYAPATVTRYRQERCRCIHKNIKMHTTHNQADSRQNTQD